MVWKYLFTWVSFVLKKDKRRLSCQNKLENYFLTQVHSRTKKFAYSMIFLALTLNSSKIFPFINTKLYPVFLLPWFNKQCHLFWCWSENLKYFCIFTPPSSSTYFHALRGIVISETPGDWSNTTHTPLPPNTCNYPP